MENDNSLIETQVVSQDIKMDKDPLGLFEWADGSRDFTKAYMARDLLNGIVDQKGDGPDPLIEETNLH